jgi:hypothetical protein
VPRDPQWATNDDLVAELSVDCLPSVQARRYGNVYHPGYGIYSGDDEAFGLGLKSRRTGSPRMTGTHVETFLQREGVLELACDMVARLTPLEFIEQCWRSYHYTRDFWELVRLLSATGYTKLKPSTTVRDIKAAAAAVDMADTALARRHGECLESPQPAEVLDVSGMGYRKLVAARERALRDLCDLTVFDPRPANAYPTTKDITVDPQKARWLFLRGIGESLEASEARIEPCDVRFVAMRSRRLLESLFLRLTALNPHKNDNLITALLGAVRLVHLRFLEIGRGSTIFVELFERICSHFGTTPPKKLSILTESNP